MISDANITLGEPDSRDSGNGGGIFSAAHTPLPADILERARDRVRIAGLTFAGLWLFVILMNEVVGRLLGAAAIGAVWSNPQSLLSIAGFVLSLAVALAVTRLRDKPHLALNLGLAYEFASALIVAILTEWLPRNDPQAVSWVCVIIILYPSIAPASPRKTLAVALASATTIPIAILVNHWRGVQLNPHLFYQLWFILPAYVCAFLAVIPATVIRALGRQVRKARELGSYRLGELLGKGGMGEVYRAKHRLLARPAAVKLISPRTLEATSAAASRVIVERFRREAQAAATLRSPHTIELYDYGVAEDGTFYYVMELLDGIDLQELVKRYGPVPPERAVYLMRQACESLGEAHQRGLIHRDAKPSNVFTCRMGLSVDYVKVLDFGLVKKEADAPEKALTLTAEGTVTGTPAFIAPEVVSGKAVGPTADVYALGCLTYWLLTGEYVFKATNAMGMLAQHLQVAPVPPSVRTPNPIPAKLDEIVLACLAKDPEKRPQNAIELARRFDECTFPALWTEARAQEWWSTNLSGIR
jgi:eukaryotic-like serine/threonine-protein kinase